MTIRFARCLAVFLAIVSFPIQAKEIILTIGGGSQPHSDQRNRSAGVDFGFYRYKRSPRQHLQVGISYTQVRTDADEHTKLWAISIYPQLSLYPDEGSRFRGFFPTWAAPYFFVRALAPTYLSEKQLGDREQAKHFAFQAQVGLGLSLDLGHDRTGVISLSYKHFSNASLFKPNEGIDIPLVLSLGLKL